jgi:hypothetical protein
MGTRVKYIHGPAAGQIEEIEDQTYAFTLVQTGYAAPAPPVEPEEPVQAKKVKKAKAKKAKSPAKKK